MTARELDLDTPCERRYDVDEVVAGIPRTYLVKGMYLSPLVKLLGDRWPAVERTMVAAPDGGRYLPFKDYPQADHSRLLFAVADRVHPTLPNSEGLRRLARQDFLTFADSTLGRVILTLVHDARAAVHKIPFVYANVAKGEWTFATTDLDERTVRLELLGSHGVWEYQLGQFEGVVINWGVDPRIVVTRLGDTDYQFDIRVR